MFNNLSKILSGINKTINITKQAIPLYKQAKPIYTNVKRFMNTMNTVKEETRKETINNIKLYERPINNFSNKETEERGNINLDTLTFFN